MRIDSRLRVPRWKEEYCSVNAPCTYFLFPAGADRVVSSNPAPSAAVIRVRISRTTSAARLAAARRHEWMKPPETAAPGHIGDQVPAPLDRMCWKTTR